VKSATVAQRFGIVVLIAIVSIAFHEFGHFTVYRLAGCPVRITLQSVRPIGHVNGSLNLVALAAGPAFSLIGAILCLLIGRRRPGFFWITAAFTNSTLRLVPLVIDIIQAIEKTTPFSDEGDVVLAITTNPVARAVILLSVFAVFLSLTVVVARRYRFEKHRAAKIVAIYVLSLAVGIAILFIDQMLH
jgi:hypothetical protein